MDIGNPRASSHDAVNWDLISRDAFDLHTIAYEARRI
jgi:hypothetical protein